MNSLTTTDTGRYHVATVASTYDIDLDAMTLSRVNTDGTNPKRADGNVIDLLGIVLCEVGHEAVFLITGLTGFGPTIRRTTVVRSIEVL